MNRCPLTMLLACLLAVPIAQAADEEDHAAHHPGADQSQAAPAQDGKAAGMQDQLKKMQDLMSKIHSTSDPQERDKLMKEHMAAMLKAIKSMRAMMGEDSMMGKKQRRDDAGAKKDSRQHGEGAASGGPSDGDQGGEMMMGGMMMKMHKRMQEGMDAMQKMMEQIIEHEAMEQEMTGK